MDSIKVVNVVATAKLNCGLDLEFISAQLASRFNRKKFSGLSLKFSHIPATVLLFSNGKIVLLGAQNISSLHQTLRELVEKLNSIGIPALHATDLHVCNIVVAGQCRTEIDLTTFAQHSSNVIFESELFPGAHFYEKFYGFTGTVFTSGKFFVAGSKTVETALKNAKYFLSYLQPFRKKTLMQNTRVEKVLQSQDFRNAVENHFEGQAGGGGAGNGHRTPLRRQNGASGRKLFEELGVARPPPAQTPFRPNDLPPPLPPPQQNEAKPSQHRRVKLTTVAEKKKLPQNTFPKEVQVAPKKPEAETAAVETAEVRRKTEQPVEEVVLMEADPPPEVEESTEYEEIEEDTGEDGDEEEAVGDEEEEEDEEEDEQEGDSGGLSTEENGEEGEIDVVADSGPEQKQAFPVPPPRKKTAPTLVRVKVKGKVQPQQKALLATPVKKASRKKTEHQSSNGAEQQEEQRGSCCVNKAKRMESVFHSTLSLFLCSHCSAGINRNQTIKQLENASVNINLTLCERYKLSCLHCVLKKKSLKHSDSKPYLIAQPKFT